MNALRSESESTAIKLLPSLLPEHPQKIATVLYDAEEK